MFLHTIDETIFGPMVSLYTILWIEPGSFTSEHLVCHEFTLYLLFLLYQFPFVIPFTDPTSACKS